MNARIKTAGQDNYWGKILTGKYSERLKKRLTQCITALYAFDKTGVPAIAYVSAWKENDRVMWYEYVSANLCSLLNCRPQDVAAEFRRRIIDRREYKYQQIKDEVREEIIPKKELESHREGLRKEGKKKGSVEAVYKLFLPEDEFLWLKDKANIEYYEEDGVCLSIGCLTVVTKEMDHKELLEKIGYFDELTKLPKRKILQRILDINIGQVERRHLNDFTFLMIDIDHFKKVNDTYGHQVGDAVLESVSELMNAIKRKEDELGRYGGEEFYAVSHGSIESGRRFAERLRKRIETTPIQCNGHTISITVSIGVSAASELPALEPDHLLELADKRLYTAKQAGRNRVVWRDEP